MNKSFSSSQSLSLLATWTTFVQTVCDYQLSTNYRLCQDVSSFRNTTWCSSVHPSSLPQFPLRPTDVVPARTTINVNRSLQFGLDSSHLFLRPGKANWSIQFRPTLGQPEWASTEVSNSDASSTKKHRHAYQLPTGRQRDRGRHTSGKMSFQTQPFSTPMGAIRCLNSSETNGRAQRIPKNVSSHSITGWVISTLRTWIR